MPQSPEIPTARDVADSFGRPVRDLRISVTDRCNFRCPYCMPAEVFGEKYEFLPRYQILTFKEIRRLSRLFVAAGVSKIRVTGGEPLVRTDLPKLISKLATIDGLEDLTLTTNGFLLAQHAAALKDAGLNRLTVSLDSLDEEIFKKMSGRPQGPAKTLEGIRVASALGFSQIKINVVVQRGTNEHTLVETARYFRGTGAIVRFIEFMDVGTRNGWDLSKVVPASEILDIVGTEFPVEPVAPNYRGEVASRYRYTDGAGEIGIISSVSAPFCGDCTRARLSTDGKLFTCLFATGGTDLKTPIRSGASDDELAEIIGTAWKGRDDRYSELRSKNTRPGARSGDRVEMYYIGG